MKKKILIFTALLVLAVLTTAVASQGIIDAIKIATMDEVPGSTSPDTNVALYTIEKNVKKGKSVQEDIEAYAYFLSYLEPSEEEIRYIDNLIAKDYSTKALVQIFEFWKDTEEEIKIIENVYELKPADLDVLYWVDSAFIELDNQGKTKTHYSNLSVEEVKEYYKNGIGYEEMMIADKLSRKGTKDIETILEQKAKKTSWYEIIDGVYNISSEEDEADNIDKYKNIDNPDEILKSISRAKKEEKSVSKILDKVLEGESSIVYFKKNADNKYSGIKAEFIKEGLWSESAEKEIKSAKEGAFK